LLVDITEHTLVSFLRYIFSKVAPKQTWDIWFFCTVSISEQYDHLNNRYQSTKFSLKTRSKNCLNDTVFVRRNCQEFNQMTL
jgi:lysyl-tRNA synthetase class I